jgi:hypothetical protein
MLNTDFYMECRHCVLPIKFKQKLLSLQNWVVLAGEEVVQSGVIGKIGTKGIRLSRGQNETWSFSRSGQSTSKSCGLFTCTQSTSRIFYSIYHEGPGFSTPRGQLVRQSDGKNVVTLPLNLRVEDKALILVGSVIAVSAFLTSFKF